MSTSTRVIKNTIYLYIRMGVSIIVSVFTTRILLQALGASDYGLYNVVAGALSMLGFLSASLSTATQRFISYAEGEGDMNKIKEIFTTSMILHWLMALAVAVLFLVCGFVFFNGVLNIPEGRELTAILVYGCLIISTVFSVVVVPYDAVLNAHENMLFYSILGILDVVFKLVIAIIVLYSDWDRLLFYGFLMAAESFFFRYLTQLYCLNHYAECRNVKIRSIPDIVLLKRMGSFAGWNVLNIGSGMISLYGMNIIINHFFGTILNAAMGIANQLAGVLLGVSSNMTKALTPVLVKSEGAQEREQMLFITIVGCKFSYLLYSMICIPVLFYTPLLLKMWLRDFPEWTVLFTRLMIISCLIDQLFVFLYQTIQAQGNIRDYNILRSIVNIIPIPIAVWQFLCGWNPSWIIIDWIIFKVIFGGFLNLYYAKRNVNLSISQWLNKVFVPCGLITVLSSLLGYALMQAEHNEFRSQIACLFVLFSASLPFYWFIGIGRNERKKVLNRIKR